MEELRRSLKWVPPYEIIERIRAKERLWKQAVQEAEEDRERRGK
uniref:Uncharacterized protein n=1 Tax=Candidatus Kentrum sp. MB TaxID=2138164 RepID=A0A450XTM1_9GAMM|nr:MAG: hypothetical protein BECKMB1821G_GA0114241_1001113 [Candidatus Kentron sp. MB]VFK32651.1 MAG: hypothetical protein BECKMB1821I_GA0114274_103533 [Candidatus Kentron sp. MB]VFK76013.1 MAG: hypothetical protein BECKMB1821H_GA0114242_103832 [Candidatus Kentron sp. MB]